MTEVDETYEEESRTKTKSTRDVVPGLIYMSFIPPNMTPFHVRQMFEKYGEVGRIYLQPDGTVIPFLQIF